MPILETLKDRSIRWRGNPQAQEEAIQTLLNESQVPLPEDYLNLLRFNNGGDGTFGTEPMDVEIWPAEEVLQANRDLCVEEFLPGDLVFGGDGANERLAFNTKEATPWKVYMVPMMVMSKEAAIGHADEFDSFIGGFGNAPKNA
jgi:hypothetical protein